MAFRLSEGDLVRYTEIMERVSLGRMLEFVEMMGLEATLHPKGKRRKKGLPSAR
jgi:hypothetical protein